MIFKQFRYEPLGQASYLLGCSRAKEAFVVDPISNLGSDFYVLEAADLTLGIVGVLETHVHADYISCARELADATGATHYLPSRAPVKYAFTALADDQELRLGQLRVRVLFTPGHTPEHCSYLVADLSRGSDPWFVLTGDSLFVGDVGRPDLLVGEQALDVFDESERARLQYESIRRTLFALPDHVEVYPNHYGGSACGGINMSGKVSSTIYFEKHHNLAMLKDSAESFARFVRETAKPFPANYTQIKSYNLGLTGKPVQEAAHA